MLNYKIKNNLLNRYHNLFSENLNFKISNFYFRKNFNDKKFK